MARPRSIAAAFFVHVVASLPGVCVAAPSDAMLDSLAFAAVNHDLSGRSGERDRTEATLLRALQERLAADSGDANAQKRLREFHRLQEARTKASETAWSEIRRLPPDQISARLEDFLLRFPTHAEALDLRKRLRREAALGARNASPPGTTGTAAAGPDTGTADQATAAPSAPEPRPGDSIAIDTSRCADLSRIDWTNPKPPRFQTTKSEVRIQANIWAPCGISRISLIRGIGDIQALPIPEASGVYTIDATVGLQRGSQTLLVQFCDSVGHCRRSEPLEVRRVFGIPFPVMIAAVGLFLCSLLLAIAILLRRRRPAAAPAPQRGLVLGATEPTATSPHGVGGPATPPDLATEIRESLERTTRSLGAKAARQTLRIPGSLPTVSAPTGELAAALDTIFCFAYRRAGASGQVMVATGRGPRSIEMVVEDDGDSSDELAVRGIFDPGVVTDRERLGMDRELLVAAGFFRSIGGELSAEIRLEGGWRLRARLPIASKPALAAAGR